jgi:hypothetical protein
MSEATLLFSVAKYLGSKQEIIHEEVLVGFAFVKTL